MKFSYEAQKNIWRAGVDTVMRTRVIEEATEHCEYDLAEKPKHYEGAVFSVGSPA